MEIIRPYRPRWYQADFEKAMETHKRAFLLYHRRAGKDISCWNYMIYKALDQTPGTYFYILPTYAQGKRVIWNGINEEGFRMLDYIPREVIDGNLNGTEMFVRLINGSTIQVVGSENYDALRGTNPRGVVFSEYAMQNPKVYTEVISPILRKNGGWAVFNTCVNPNTQVLTKDGLRKISRIMEPDGEYTEYNAPIYGLGGFHNATHFYYGGVQDTLILTTKKGYQIECTKVHPLWTGWEWKKSMEWKIGDRIPIQRGQNVFSRHGIDIKEWKRPEWDGVKGRKNLLPEDFLDLDFLYLMGLWLAEGCYSGKSTRTGKKNSITITNPDEEIHEFLLSKGFKSHDNLHWSFGSTEMCSFFKWFGLSGTAKQKKLPEKLHECNRDQIKAFLQGYFDGDGHASKKPYGSVSICSASEELMSDLHVLLLNFGIVARRSAITTKPTTKVKKTCTAYKIEIEGYNAWKFYNEVGFRLSRKQKRSELLKQCVKEGDGSGVVLDHTKIPSIHFPASMVTNKNNINYRTLKKLNDKNPHPELKRTLTDNFYWDEISEISEGKSEVYDFVIPETHSFFSNGFISHNTPMGKNHAYDLWMMGSEERQTEWYTQKLTIADTGLISRQQIESEIAEGKSDEIIQQEYYCSFARGIDGTYYGRMISDLYDKGRITSVPYDDYLEVHTAWDLGISDATSIWFYQETRGGEIHVIDFYENSGEALSHYAKVIKSKDYNYGRHFFPHDVKARELGSGSTREEMLRKLGIKPTMAPKLGVADGIQSARAVLPRCWFDQDKCKDGIKHLENYRKHYSDKLRSYVDRPLHNEHSHAADAWRYLSASVLKKKSGGGMTQEEADRMYQQYSLGV